MASMNQLDAIVSIASDLTAALSSEERYRRLLVVEAGRSIGTISIIAARIGAQPATCARGDRLPPGHVDRTMPGRDAPWEAMR